MKTNRLAIGVVLVMLVSMNLSLRGQTGDLPYVVEERGANYRVWERTVLEYSVAGDLVPQTHRYTEVATGMNYKDGRGQWVESEENIQPQAGRGAAAVHGQYQAYFPYDLYQGVIQVVTPAGEQLQSRPLGLSYDDGSQTVLIAEIKRTVGQLVGSNQVIYPEAFTGLKADVRYTYTKAGFEQDIILREQPPAPGTFGLNPQTARLQVLTEFFDSPEPRAVGQRGRGEAGNGLTDTTLEFGGMEMEPGQALSVADTLRMEVAGMHRTPHGQGRPVYKTWTHLEGRTFLIEELPYEGMQAELENLPRGGEQARGKNATGPKARAGRVLPAGRPAVAVAAKPLPVAGLDLKGAAGVVLDYDLINSSQANFTFQGDTTYLISGGCSLSGTTTIEGGAVIKFDDSTGPYLEIVGTLNCQTASYHPAVLTDKNDDTVGETISNSSGVPTTEQNSYYLYLDGAPNYTVRNLRFSYAQAGLSFDNGYPSFPVDVWDCQFMSCQYAVMLFSGTNVLFHNALFGQCSNAVSFYYALPLIGEQMTVAGGSLWDGSALVPAAVCLTNSIIVATVGNGPALNTNGVVINPSGTIFQTAGAGSYYLATRSPYRNAGTLNINPALLADLRQKTTQAPQWYSDAWIDGSWPGTWGPTVARDTNALNVDLGYHYDPLDFYFDGYNIFFSGTVTLTNGVAVGFGGPFLIEPGASLISQGKANQLNRLVQCRTVQEEAINWASDPTLASDSVYCSSTVNCRFTDFSRLAGPGGHVSDDYKGGVWDFRDCGFHGTQVSFAGQGCALNVGLTNCLFERTKLYADGSNVTLSAYNNLFDQGDVWLISSNAGNAFTFRDNFFYCNNLTNWIVSGVLTNDHNGYVTNYNLLSANEPGAVIVTTVPFPFQSSWLGHYYQPTNSPLINEGSTTADQLGLYHYTVTTNQVVEGFSPVSIGYHYVAVDGNGNPLDSNGDGIPDYIEDANGNGVVGPGETPWGITIVNPVDGSTIY
jgi:hypothetical protein